MFSVDSSSMSFFKQPCWCTPTPGLKGTNSRGSMPEHLGFDSPLKPAPNKNTIDVTVVMVISWNGGLTVGNWAKTIKVI